MAWASGQKLQGGKYTIKNELGLGDFGITYLARDNNGRQIVIKTLNDKVQCRSDFGKFQQDFLNEALRLAKCSHSHIVRIDEVIQEGALWGMVMEYVAGEDLASRVEKQGALPEAEALRYIQQIGEALTVVHNNGLLYRDVKPTNIMLRSGKSEAVLIDFGIAREFTPNLTQTHTQMLSDGFAPLEQYDKRAKRGAYTNVYALAATLYSLLTGEVPTLAPLRAAGMSLEPPKQINPSISDRVNQAIIKGMEVNAGDRPQLVQEWLAFLGMRIYPTTPSFPQVPPVIPVTSPPCYQSPLQSASVQLVSAVGVDYSKLRDLLAAGKWKEADRETERVMLWVAGRERQGWFRTEDIEQFPCKDFCTIDQLWMKYSKGRFGFSVQKRIWKSVNGRWQKYGNIVGWRMQDLWVKYDSLTFTIDAPFGHLPVSCCKAYISWDWWTLRFLRSGVFGCGGASIRCLALRLISCNEH